MREEIESAFGDELESLDVRTVRVDYGEPFPFSLISGMPGGEEAIYVEYKLKGVDVVIADVPGGPWGFDLVNSGILPVRGSLASRMTHEQFGRILRAYAEETEAPLGSVRRYGDSSGMMYYDSPSPDEIVVAGIEYPTKELWSAVEGTLIEGERIDMSLGMDYVRKALVFHEHPETGEFEYLGSESVDMYW